MVPKKHQSVAAVLLMASLMAAGLYFVQGKAAAVPAAASPSVIYALLRVSSSDPLGKDSEHSQNADEYARMMRTQVELIKSRAVLGAALAQKEVAGLSLFRNVADPLEWLEKRLLVECPNNSELLRVSMTGLSPDELAVIINAVVDAYLQNVAHGNRTELFHTLNELEKTTINAQERILQQQRSLSRLAEALRGLDPFGDTSMKRSILQEKLVDCTRELRRVRLEKAGQKARLARRQAAQKPNQPLVPSVTELEEQIDVLNEQEKLLSAEESQLNKRMEQFSTVSFELKTKERQLDQARQIVSQLHKQRERLSVEAQWHRQPVVILQKAESPRGK